MSTANRIMCAVMMAVCLGLGFFAGRQSVGDWEQTKSSLRQCNLLSDVVSTKYTELRKFAMEDHAQCIDLLNDDTRLLNSCRDGWAKCEVRSERH